MKYIYTVLLFGLVFVGCGYKTDTIYVEDKKEIKK